MPTYSLGLLLLIAACAGCGFMGMAWYRCGGGERRACWGRRLFLGTLSALGVGSLVAAWQPRHGLVYLGLAVGALLIAMLWETPGDLTHRAALRHPLD